MTLFSAKPDPSENSESHHSITVGQTSYVQVYANRLWNDSHIDVRIGQIYTVHVPENERWRDATIECGPNGYQSPNWWFRAFERLRRDPKANWFQLIGTIGRSRARFVVGAKPVEFVPPFPGRLYFFANDVPFMYWNNRGALSLRITRMQ